MGPPLAPHTLDRNRAAARRSVRAILNRPEVRAEIGALKKYLIPEAPPVASGAPNLVGAGPQQDQLRAYPSTRDHVPLWWTRRRMTS